MSQENLEIVRGTIDSFNDGQLAWESYDPGIEFTTRGDVDGGNTYRGVDGLRRALEGFSQVWSSMRVEVQELIETEEAIVALLRFHLSGRGSGVVLDVEEAWAYWLHDGKIRRIQQYGTKRDAVQAVGLSE